MVKICAAELAKSLILSHSALFIPREHRHSFSAEEKQKTSSANETVTSKQLSLYQTLYNKLNPKRVFIGCYL